MSFPRSHSQKERNVWVGSLGSAPKSVPSPPTTCCLLSPKHPPNTSQDPGSRGLAREGTGWLISYHWASRHLESSWSVCSAPAPGWGGKGMGRGRGADPSHWLPRHDITRRWVVGKQTSPLPATVTHKPVGGEPRHSLLPGVTLPPGALLLGFACCSSPLKAGRPTSASSWLPETSMALLVSGAPKINPFHSLSTQFGFKSQLSHFLTM